MSRLLIWTMFIAAYVAVVLGLQADGGAVSVWWSGWRIDMALSTAVFSVSLLVLAVWLLARGVDWLTGLPDRLRSARDRSRARHRVESLADLMLDFSEGRYSRVIKAAAGLQSDLRDQNQLPINVSRLVATLAARAAHALGDTGQRDLWLGRVGGQEVGSANHPQLKSLLVAEFALDDHLGQTALKALEPLTQGDRKHIYAKRLLLRAQQQVGHHAEVLRLVRLLENRKAIVPLAAHRARESAVEGLLRSARHDRQELRRALAELKGDERLEPRVARLVAQAQLAAGLDAEARKTLEAALKREWDDRLVGLYAHCRDDPKDQLARLEGLAKDRQPSYELHFARGQFCRSLGQLDTAEAHLEEARKLRATAEVCLSLAELADQRGAPERVRQLSREAAQSLFSLSSKGFF